MTLERAALVAAALAAGAAAHYGVARAARRAARRLARRRGASPAAPGAMPAALALGAFALQLAIWSAAAWLALEPFPGLRALRADAVALLAQSLRAPLVAWSGRSFSALDVLLLPVLAAAVWTGAHAGSALVRAHVLAASALDRGAQDAIAMLLRAALAFLGAVVLLQAAGVDLRSVAIGASVLGVGIGFGLQNIANNFVSGVLLNLQRPVRPGDFVHVGEYVGTVLRIGARSTEIVTLDRVTILVPNSRFLENEVVNWTHGDPVSRIRVPVSVAAGADPGLVRHALLEAAQGHPGVLRDPRPDVALQGFGDGSLDFALLVWTLDPRRQFALASDLRIRIEASLRRHAIAFPEREVRVRAPELARALAAWALREGTGAPPPEAAAVADAAEGGPRAAHPCEASSGLGERGPEDWSAEELETCLARMRGEGGVPVSDRRHLFATYRGCFVGSEAVDWLVAHEGLSRREAVVVGERLVALGRIRHVLDEHGFRDGRFFFRFAEARAAA